MSGLLPGAKLDEVQVTSDHASEEAHADVGQGVTVDEYLEIIGEFGPYQIRNYFIVASAWAACSWCTLSMVCLLSFSDDRG